MCIDGVFQLEILVPAVIVMNIFCHVNRACDQESEIRSHKVSHLAPPTCQRNCGCFLWRQLDRAERKYVRGVMGLDGRIVKQNRWDTRAVRARPRAVTIARAMLACMALLHVPSWWRSRGLIKTARSGHSRIERWRKIPRTMGKHSNCNQQRNKQA